MALKWQGVVSRSMGIPIVICADDFGIAPGVNDAIVELIARGVITATSVMPAQTAWHDDAARTLAAVVRGRAEVGWHVTLTEQRPAFAHGQLVRAGRLPPLKRLLAQALARALPLAAVRDELRAQLDAFEDAWGAPPAFVDGHQHVHLLPGVREVLLAELQGRYPLGTIWARDCTDTAARIRRRGVGLAKARFLAWLGRGWRKLLDAHGLARNDGFAGAHDFAPQPPFREKFRAFLRAPGPRHLVFVHPGWPDATLRACETLVDARQWEYEYLSSSTCGEDMHALGVYPARRWGED